MNDYWKDKLEPYNIEILEYEQVDEISNIKICNLKFKSFDKSIINTKIIVPQKSNSKILLNIHGLGTHLTDYYDIIPFALLGYTVASIDIRGQGGLSEDFTVYKGDVKRSFIARGIEDNGENLYYKNVLLDHYYLCEWLKNNEYTPSCNSIDIFGGSQGGGLGLMLAAIRKDINKAVIFYPYLADIFNGLKYSSDVYSELSKYLKHSDPLGENIDYIKDVINNIDPINFIDDINCDILYGISYKDSSVPFECQKNMYDKLKCSKTLLAYRDHGHEKLPYIMDKSLEFLRD